MTTIEFERLTDDYYHEGIFTNCRVESDEGIVDLCLSKSAAWPNVKRLRDSLRSELDKHHLPEVRLSVDVDRLLRLRFINIHIPLDNRIALRMALIGAAVRRWRKDYGIYYG